MRASPKISPPPQVLLGLWLCIVPFAAAAQPPGRAISGGAAAAPAFRLPPIEQRFELYSQAGLDLQKDGEREARHSEYSEISAEIKYVENPRLQAALGGDFKLFHEGGIAAAETVSGVRLDNAYLNFLGEHYNVRLGSQVVRWGKTDEVSPLDNINPEDLRTGPLRRRGDRKLAVPILNAELFDQQQRLQAVFAPLFARSKIRFFQSDWALFGYEPEASLEEQKPSGIEGGSCGARYSGSIGKTDFGISLLSFVNHLPAIAGGALPPEFPGLAGSPGLRDLAASAAAAGLPLEVQYERKQVAGMELETVWDALGLRADFAYSSRDSFVSRRLEELHSPVWSYVLGVDYRAPEDSYINLQLGQSYIEDYDSGLLFNERTATTSFLEVSHEFWEDNLKVGGRGLYEFSQAACFLNPYLQLLYFDSTTIELGAEILDGRHDSLLGTFHANDQLYLSGQLVF